MMPMRRRAHARAIVSATVTIGIAILAMAATLVVMDVPARDALAALWRGAFGSGYAISSATLVRAVPLVLTGLAVALAFRAGVFNIGAEGQLLVGASAAAAVASVPGFGGSVLALPVMLVAGAAAGGAWAGVAAWLRRRFDVLEVISTILLNFVAIHLIGFLVRGPLQEPTRIYPQTPMLEESARLPLLIAGSRLHAGALLALALAIALWAFLRETAAGFRLRVTGANAAAAASAGEIDIAAVATRAFLASGAIAGIAGAVEVTGVTYALYENISPGYGYTAIAVALLARLHPLGILAAGTLFGGLEAGAAAMQREAGVPASLVHALVAVAILGVVAATRPRADG